MEHLDGSSGIDLLRILVFHLMRAIGIRERLGLLQGAAPACRLVNGEGDRVSGLCVDLYGRYLVVQSAARWVEEHRKQIETALEEATSHKYLLIWRPNWDRLRQDGMRKDHGLYSLDPSKDHGSETECPMSLDPITIIENDIAFQVDLEHGQKTGHYCDQRDNRLFIRQLVRDAQIERVLDLCTYTGGFALNAILGGAGHVTAVDSSSQALTQAQKNAVINQVPVTLVLDDKSSVLEPPQTTLWLQRDDIQRFCDRHYAQAAERGDHDLLYDLVVLDPPKLAPTIESLPRARHRYRKMNAAAMRIIRKGGFLFTCTCSASMTQSGQFSATLMEAACDVGRRITILAERGAALDHVISPSAPEGRYLTGLLLAVE
jgi:23S rRNA G2069 N7-methylase RlmK/C1962 C5-methylase RlmI